MTPTPQPRRESTAALLRLGMQCHQRGDLLGAEARYRDVLGQDAQHAFAWHLLALVEYQRGNWLPGLEHIRRAIGLNSRVPQFHVNLGNLLKAAGRTQEAVHAYYLAVAMDPAYAEAYNNLGNTYLALGTWGEAEACLRAAVRLEPANADALSNLGAALHEQGKLEEALECLRQALEHRPGFAEGWYNLGNALLAQGDNEASINAYQRAVEGNSNLMEGWYNLANALARADRFEEAGACYQKAITLKPDHVAAIFNFGNVLQAAGCLDESITCYAEVLRLKPDHAGAHFCWGNALNSNAKPAEAAEHYDLALALDPAMAKAYHMKGGALYNQGRVDEAIRTSMKALELKPDMPLTFSNSLFMLNYEPEVGPEEQAARHREFDARFCAQAAVLLVHANDRDLHRRLRVGYVSPDLRRHSVAYFIEPVLARHDPAQVEVTCYFNSSLADDVTQRLRGYAAQWVDCYWMSNDELAARIAADRIDILVDLAGHTAGNRLLTFARKPAPIQVSYLGYPTSTGLSSIDYRITDEQVDPDGYEAFNTGQLLRMPESYYCYRPMADVPDVAPLPAAATGAVTFGSFNNLAKVSDEALALWARVIGAVPGSRLLLKAKSLADPAVEDRMRQRLERLGVTADRLLLRGWEPTPGGHLPLYAQVDIGLDTFPYNGGTTTCEALWMGVPVITLCGATHASRMGRSLLKAAGYPALVAEDAEQFVRIASDFGHDLESLSALRAELRNRMRASALMDEVRFTRQLEAQYRRIWQQWCREAGTHVENSHGASSALQRAAEIDGSFESLVNLGAVVREAGEPERALDILGRAHEMRPGSELVYNNLGLALRDLGRHAEAVQCFRRARELAPADAAPWNNLGLGLQALGDDQEAEACFQRSAGLAPDWVEPLVNLANLRSEEGKFEQAAELLRTAARTHPDVAEVHGNLGVQLAALGNHAEAIASFDRALVLKPKLASAALNLGMVKLALGEYAEGWRLFEHRWQATEGLAPLNARFSHPRWEGDALDGRTILLHAEQGLGDTLQFIRYAPLVAAQGGRVVVECQAALTRLLKHVDGVADVRAFGQPLPHFDIHCSLLSLSRVLGTRLDTIPARIPYIQVPDAIGRKWRRRLRPTGAIRVGIVWSGDARANYRRGNVVDRRRSVSLAALAPLARIAGIELFSLQKGPASAQTQAPPDGMRLLDLTGWIDDFLDTAGLVANLDLVVSVDTSVVHLAGALGKPVWLLSRSDGCWRWLLGREDSPWYPTLRIFRQERPLVWQPVIERVAEELSRFASGCSSVAGCLEERRGLIEGPVAS